MKKQVLLHSAVVAMTADKKTLYQKTLASKATITSASTATKAGGTISLEELQAPFLEYKQQNAKDQGQTQRRLAALEKDYGELRTNNRELWTDTEELRTKLEDQKKDIDFLLAITAAAENERAELLEMKEDLAAVVQTIRGRAGAK